MEKTISPAEQQEAQSIRPGETSVTGESVEKSAGPVRAVSAEGRTKTSEGDDIEGAGTSWRMVGMIYDLRTNDRTAWPIDSNGSLPLVLRE